MIDVGTDNKAVVDAGFNPLTSSPKSQPVEVTCSPDPHYHTRREHSERERRIRDFDAIKAKHDVAQREMQRLKAEHGKAVEAAAAIGEKLNRAVNDAADPKFDYERALDATRAIGLNI